MLRRLHNITRGMVLPGVVVLAISGMAHTSSGQCEIDELLAADGLAFDEFGTAVAISGEVLVVGAPRHDQNGSSAGAAYVYRFDVNGSGTWAQETKLLPSELQAYDRFGLSVAVDGNVILVGAYGDDDNGGTAGAAYVFRYDPDASEWLEETKLLASDGASADYFGYSVAIDGNVAVAGAYRDDDNGSRSGSAYVFRFNDDSGGWLQEAKLIASDGTAFDEFGRVVAVTADRILIGAPEDDAVGYATGSAYVFGCGEGCRLWVEEAKLLPLDVSPLTEFGRAVAIRDDLAIIGAPGHDHYGFHSGAAFVFRRVGDGQVWVQEAELLASDGGGHQHFGRSVGIDGEVGHAAPIGEERIAGIAPFLVLLHGILDALTGQRILELGGEDWDADLNAKWRAGHSLSADR
ncbi:MAG: FG-GAP repeat protein, partial [Planctomycetes bacterium]|nr:FG-GAP repeat protein [Planctomycetota bacterium]